jgi:hypothetical protein
MLSDAPWSVQLAPLWFMLLFAGMWLVITGVLSRVSGWTSLATQFRATQPTSGEKFRFVSGSVGKKGFPVGYRNCLFVSVGERGLGLAILFLFRFQSPSLFIPWSQVESVAEKKIFFARYVVICLRNQWPAISLRGPAGERVKEVYARLPSSLSGRGDR